MKSYFRKEFKYQLKQLWRKWYKPLIQCSIAFFVSFGSIYFWGSEAGQRLDLWILRQFFETRGTLPAPKEVVIAAIDDLSYQKLEASPRLPFPRILVAKAMREIVEAKPRVLIIDANIPREQTDLEADQILEDALRAGPTTIWSGIHPQDNSNLDSSDPNNYVTISSEDRFRKAAKMELPMLVASSLDTVSLIGHNLKQPSSLFDFIPLTKALVQLGNYKINLPGKLDLINYYGPSGTISRISLYKFLSEEKDSVKESIRNKTVFMGFQSLGRARGQIDKDEYYISASTNPMFGVEIHANIAANLIEDNWIRRLDVVSEITILFLCALVLCVLALALAPEKGIPLMLVLTVITLATAYYSFLLKHFWLGGIGTIALVAFLSILGSAVYNYLIIKQFKRYVEKTFDFEKERGI